MAKRTTKTDTDTVAETQVDKAEQEGVGAVVEGEAAGAEGATSSVQEETPASDIPQTTETGEAAGRDSSEVPPATAPNEVGINVRADPVLDEKTIEAIKTQILGIPAVERRRFLVFKAVRHDNVRTPAGGLLTLIRTAHASLAARHLVSEDWDDGLPEES